MCELICRCEKRQRKQKGVVSAASRGDLGEDTGASLTHTYTQEESPKQPKEISISSL